MKKSWLILDLVNKCRSLKIYTQRSYFLFLFFFTPVCNHTSCALLPSAPAEVNTAPWAEIVPLEMLEAFGVKDKRMRLGLPLKHGLVEIKVFYLTI